jgi:hypothetical protein
LTIMFATQLVRMIVLPYMMSSSTKLDETTIVRHTCTVIHARDRKQGSMSELYS